MKSNQEAILLVLPWSPDLPGGVSVVVRNLARTWQAADVPVSILVSDWSSKTAKRNLNGTHSLRLAILGKSTLLGLLKSLLFLPLILWRTLSLLKQQHIGTVYFHYANLDAFGVALLKRLGLYPGRLILCFHGTDVRKPKNRLTRAVWDFIFRSASAVTACSNALARGVETTYGLPDGGVATVYNGVNTDIFSRESANRSAPGSLFDAPIQRYIVSVGSFIERKGHRSLLEAFARVSGVFPGLGLVIVGMDGDQRASLEARVEALGLQTSIRILVNLQPTQVAEVVAGATLCVQPSIAEPFGMAVIEAGACGVCVAASAVGGHMELISHGQTGFLFQATDVDGIASLLVDVLEDDVRRARVAEAFYAKVISEFTWKACADLYRAGGSRCAM
jgi:glycosyltransferase involved in cell wall biosynthesis